MQVKVSVVVPVYNPGHYIDELLASLQRQSLPPPEFEVIFVDDSSTDGTAERLDALAGEVSNFRLIRIPHSGWPGRPRNVGVDAARGEYVLFVDNDDVLGDEALERMWKYAKANDSDIVVGREVRPRTHRPMGDLFRTNRPRAALGRDPLLNSLTPHKMFRRAFLAENDIRFLEGPRRLEDHQFVVRAYFRARVISVLADYPCYFWMTPRPDRSNAGRQPRDWAEWYRHLRDTLDVVEDHTEPGPFRDGLLAHWYASKGLRFFGGTQTTRDEQAARLQFDALRDLASERFPLSVDDHLAPIMRVRSALLRAGEFARLRALAVAESDMSLRHRVDRIRLTRRQLELVVTAWLVYGDGSPMLLERDGTHWYWQPPLSLGNSVPQHALDFTSVMSHCRLDVMARREPTGERVPLPGDIHHIPAPAGNGTARLSATRAVRLRRKAARERRMRPGTWDLHLQFSAGGWQFRRALRTLPSPPRRRLLRTRPTRGRVPAQLHIGEAGQITVGDTS